MNIYILEGEEQLGPYTVGEINDKLTRGELSADTLAWFDGSPEWIPLGTISGFADVASVVAQPPSVGGQANGDVSTSAGRVEPPASLDQDPAAKASEVSAAKRGSWCVASDRSKGLVSTRSTDDRRGRGGWYLLACVIAVGVGTLAWMLTRSPESRQAESSKPVETITPSVVTDHHLEDETRNIVSPPASEITVKTPVEISPPVSSPTANNVTPADADVTDDAGDIDYRDPVIEAYLKLTPAERERTSHERSRSDAEKIWLYYFKGRDANGRPIPYTVGERKANERAYSKACKLAQEQLDRMFIRKDDTFFTTIHPNSANRSVWYLHEYKDATFRVGQDRLTEVERMNGWQWRGVVYYESKFTRTFTGTEEASGATAMSRASDWSSGTTFLSVALRCQTDQWTITRIDSAQGCTKPTDAELRALDNPPMRDAKAHSVDDSDNLGSPVGRYRKVVSDAIKARWYFMVEEQMSQISAGAGKIHFVVSPAGRVTDAKVISGDANSPLAKLSVSVVREAELPAMPADLKTALGDKPFEMDYDFRLK